MSVPNGEGVAFNASVSVEQRRVGKLRAAVEYHEREVAWCRDAVKNTAAQAKRAAADARSKKDTADADLAAAEKRLTAAKAALADSEVN